MFNKYQLVAAGVAILLLASDIAHARLISSNSFENPAVSGRINTDPDGWVSHDTYGAATDGIENEDSGTFTTPFGEQAACVWNNNRSSLQSSPSLFSDFLVPGIEYTVTCRVAKASDLSGAYNISLRAYDPDDPRTGDSSVFLAGAAATATQNDMSEIVSFSFAALPSDPSVGKMLGIKIDGGDCLVDNLVFSDDTDGSDVYPPALWYRYPRDDQQTMTVDYPLLLTFSEDVTNGTGNITIRRTSDDAIHEIIDATSGQVVISSNEVTVNRLIEFERGEAYYINVDAGAFEDLAGNGFLGVLAADQWNFATPIPDGKVVIYQTSFESPVVSGRSGTDPDGWIAGTGYGTGGEGLENEDSGSFSTPYGAQMAAFWGGADRAQLTTSTNAIADVLLAEQPYTVSFNTCMPTNLTRGYWVQLVAFSEGDPRNTPTPEAPGTVLAQASGNAILSDMAAAAVAFTFTATVDDPNLGKMLAVRLWGGNRGGMAVDNLKLTWQPPPPAGTVLVLR